MVLHLPNSPASKKSWELDCQVRRVGNGSKSTIEVWKNEEEQQSIISPTAFADRRPVLKMLNWIGVL